MPMSEVAMPTTIGASATRVHPRDRRVKAREVTVRLLTPCCCRRS